MLKDKPVDREVKLRVDEAHTNKGLPMSIEIIDKVKRCRGEYLQKLTVKRVCPGPRGRSYRRCTAWFHIQSLSDEDRRPLWAPYSCI